MADATPPPAVGFLAGKPIYDGDDEAPATTQATPAAPPVTVTDADRADPINKGLTDAQIIAAKTPADGPPETPTAGFMVGKPVYEVPDQPTPAPVEKPSVWSTVGDYGMAAAKGLGGSFNDLAISAATTAGAIPVLYDKVASLLKSAPETRAEDWYFDHFVDPSTREAFQQNPDASFGQKLTQGAGAALGMISQMVLTGGEAAAPETAVREAALASAAPKANQTLAALTPQIAHGIKGGTAPAVTAAVNVGRDVYQQTGDGQKAVAAAQASYLTNLVSAITPLSAPGGIVRRSIGGAASGAVGGEFDRQWTNPTLPAAQSGAPDASGNQPPGAQQNVAQQPFDWQQAAMNALQGAMMAGFAGPRAETSSLARPAGSPMDALNPDGSGAPPGAGPGATPPPAGLKPGEATKNQVLNMATQKIKDLNAQLAGPGLPSLDVRRQLEDLQMHIDDPTALASRFGVKIADSDSPSNPSIQAAGDAAAEKVKAEGGDMLSQTLARSQATAAAVAPHADNAVSAGLEIRRAKMILDATNDYVNGKAQEQEDAARQAEQMEAAGRYEAQKIAEAHGLLTPDAFDQAFDEAEQQRLQTVADQENKAWAQREQQIGAERGALAGEPAPDRGVAPAEQPPATTPESGRATLGDVMPPEVAALRGSTVKSEPNDEPAPTAARQLAASPSDERVGRATAASERPTATSINSVEPGQPINHPAIGARVDLPSDNLADVRSGDNTATVAAVKRGKDTRGGNRTMEVHLDDGTVVKGKAGLQADGSVADEDVGRVLAAKGMTLREKPDEASPKLLPAPKEAGFVADKDGNVAPVTQADAEANRGQTGTLTLKRAAVAQERARLPVRELNPAAEVGRPPEVTPEGGGARERPVAEAPVAPKAQRLADRRAARQQKNSLRYAESNDKPRFKTDNPGGEWLQNKRNLANEAGLNRHGAPKSLGTVTGSFRGGDNDRLILPVDKLARVPGLSGEQRNVRQNNLDWLKEHMGRTGKLPSLRADGEEYAPFVTVDQNGRAWMSEGNHRVMAAKELGWKHMPVEVRYFNGGESVPGPWHPDTLLREHAENEGTPRTPDAPRQREGAVLEGKPLTRDEATKAIAPLVKHVGEGIVNVHDRPDSDTVPQSIRERMQRDGQMDARGVYDPETDSVHVFAGNHDSAQGALETAVHETVAHKGLRHLLQDDFEPTMDDIFSNAKSHAWMRDFIAQHGLDKETPEDRQLAAEEYAAHLSEAGDSRGLLGRLYDKVRAALRSVGIVRKWSDNDIRELLRRSKSNLGDRRADLPKAEDGNLRYARQPLNDDLGLPPDHPLNVGRKYGATMQDQMSYNPGFIRSRWNALKDFGQNRIGTYLSLIPQRNLMDHMPPGVMQAGREYDRDLKLMQGRKTGLIADQKKTFDLWARVIKNDKNDAGLLGELMHASTIARNDPSKPFQPKYTGRSVTAEQRAEDMARRQTHAKLQDFYNRLSPDAKVVFRNVRDANADMIARREQGIIQRINDSKASESSKKTLIDELRQQWENGRIAPYFTLFRTGDKWASAKDKDGNPIAYIRDNSGQKIKAWRAQMEAKGLITDGGTKSDADADIAKRIDPEFVAKVTKLLSSKELSVKDAKGRDVGSQLADDIWQHYLSTMPDTSMRKFSMHRADRMGFTNNALAAFAHSTYHGASQIAKLEWMHKLEGHLSDLQKQARELEKANGAHSTWAMPLHDEYALRHQILTNPDSSSLATKITGLGFQWYLGANPATAATFLAQTPMIAYPGLGSHFGYGPAAKHLIKTLWQAAGSRGQYGNRLRGDERDAWDNASRMNLFENTFAHTLAGVAEGGDPNSARNKIGHVGSFLLHSVDTYNRQTTYMAAYRLARDAGMSHQGAMDKAYGLTQDAHFDYSSSNRPRIMQGNIQRVLFLFKQYAVGMTYRLNRDLNDSFRGFTPEQRVIARKRLGGELAMAFMHVGAQGLPWMAGYMLAKYVYNAVAGDKDHPADFDNDFRAHLIHRFGPTTATAIVKGPLDALSGATMSNRLDLANMWLRSDSADSQTNREKWTEAMGNLLGPVAGMGSRIAQAMDYHAAHHDDRALEQLVPSAVGNLLRARRFASEGVQNMKGDTLVKPEDLSGWDIALQAMGITPTKVQSAYDHNTALTNAEDSLNNRRTNLVNQVTMAIRHQDSTGVKEAEAEIEAFNKANPDHSINSKQISQAAITQNKHILEAVDGTYINPKHNALRKDYPDYNKGDAK